MGSGRALVVGISRFGAPLPDGEEVPVGDAGWDDLPFVEAVVPPVAAALARLGFKPDLHPNPDARALRGVVQDALGSAPVVYVASHGRRGARRDRVDVVPSCGLPGAGTSASQWVEDAQELGGAPTLFLFDLCHAGRAAENLVHRTGGPLGAWVMAACGSDQVAYDGVFSTVLAEVLEEVAVNGLGTDPGQRYVYFSEVARHVRQRVQARSRFVQDVVCSALDAGADEPELPFFPNGGYKTDAAALARVAPSLRGFLDAADAAHFRDKAGPRFTGRTRELELLGPWLDDVASGGLRVVTGAPGAGKSALLGVLVCAAHPELADLVPEVRARLSGVGPGVCPSVNERLAAVHARGRTAADVAAAIARQLDLAPPATGGERDGAALAALLADVPEIPALVVDAVDEAADPQGVCALLVALAAARRADGRTAVRLLVGARPWPIFRALWDCARAGDGSEPLDLDNADPDGLRRDLSAYLEAVLGEETAYRTPAMRPVRAALARAAAARLAPAGLPAPPTTGGVPQEPVRAEWGAHLVAAVFARYLKTIPPPADAPAAAVLGGSIPDGLPEVLDLDLAARPNGHRIRAVLAALALARGDGMPVEVALPLVRLFAPDLAADQVRDTLDGLALFYLRTTPDSHGVLHYRLFHQGLADHLTRHPAPAGGPSPAPTVVFDHLLATHAPTDRDGRRRWDAAPEYLLRHGVDHARDADRLDDLLTDPEYLVHAEPAALASAFRSTGTDSARRARAVYLASVNHHRAVSPQARRHVLAVDACRNGHQPLRDAFTHDQLWRPRWATSRAAAHPALRDTLGHQGPVWAVACTSLDGRPIAVTGSDDGTVRIWDLTDGHPLGKPLTGHQGSVRAVACTSLDGRPVAISGGNDGTVRIWDLTDGRQLHELRPRRRRPVLAVACSSLDGRPVAVTGGNDGSVRIWDLTDGRQLRPPLTGHQGSVRAVACTSLDGRPVAVTGGKDGSVRIWDLTDGRQLHELRAHRRSPVLAVACTSLDGRPVAVTGSNDGTVQIWDLTDGRPLGDPLTGHQGSVLAVACTSLDGRPAAVATTYDNTVHIWDLTDGRPLGDPLTGHLGSVWAVACTPLDGRSVAVTGSDDGTVRIWDLTDGRPLGRPLTGHRGSVLAVACSSLDGRSVAVTGSDDGTVRIWDLTDGRQLRGSRRRSPVLAVACTSLDGRPVAVTGSKDGTVWIWDLTDGRRLHELRTRRRSPALAVACTSLDGRPVAVTGGKDGSVWIWDLTDGQRLHALPTHRRSLALAVACTSLDGRPIAVTGGNSNVVQIWDLRTRCLTAAYLMPGEAHTLMSASPGVLVIGSGPDVIAIDFGGNPS
ncbi:PQQ-binding-like beta-propeller repeat protein [Embleya sp. NPDC020886]|uniref:outer membrane protein assembly factor BamB family protein n=1 Tax=Embleya sp. NPDC020886 TaxID=3363980 RepID=UPI0037A0E317